MLWIVFNLPISCSKLFVLTISLFEEFRDAKWGWLFCSKVSPSVTSKGRKHWNLFICVEELGLWVDECQKWLQLIFQYFSRNEQTNFPPGRARNCRKQPSRVLSISRFLSRNWSIKLSFIEKKLKRNSRRRKVWANIYLLTPNKKRTLRPEKKRERDLNFHFFGKLFRLDAWRLFSSTTIISFCRYSWRHNSRICART